MHSPGLLFLVFVACLTTNLAWAGMTERVSVSSSGEQANGRSCFYETGPRVSADGRFVAFASEASNLVPNDNNGATDVFVRDRMLGTTERVSVSNTGQEGNEDSGYRPGVEIFGVAISADGMYVAFGSAANNLVPGDTGWWDVFVRDRVGGTTERVSVADGGGQANQHSVRPSISADGRFVAFSSRASNLVPNDTNGASDVFVRDRSGSTTERLSLSSAGAQANYDCYRPRISADGRFVAFESDASNLVPNDSGWRDIFVRDRSGSTTERVSVTSGGAQANYDSFNACISVDGRFVAFDSGASNLVPGDTNGYPDVFLRDRQENTTKRVSVTATGGEAVGGDSSSASISGNGRFVAGDTISWNLVSGPYPMRQIFIRDTQTPTTEAVSISTSGEPANSNSGEPSISHDGRFVAFESDASNLVSDDTNGVGDVFVRDRADPPDMHIISEAHCTKSRDVALSITCGVLWLQMRFRNDPGEWSVWDACAASVPWTLPEGDGVKWVCAQGRDAALNQSAEVCDYILLDTTGPTGVSVEINDDAPCTSASSVLLTLAATKAAEMRFRNEAEAWSDWEPFETAKIWYLSAGRGLKTVGLQCRGWCGDESAVVTDSIRVPTFQDVTCGHSQWSYIEALVAAGITTGCQTNPPMYCPTAGITRAQMAVFIIRAMGQTPYNKPTPTFADVPAGHWAYGYIERVYALGITSGCATSPLRYCPDSAVTRSQMAVFLCRAASKAPLIPGTPTFADVPDSASFYGYVERMADPASWGGTAVTTGCAAGPPRLYCPYSPVTRGQMAVFLVRAFAIPY